MFTVDEKQMIRDLVKNHIQGCRKQLEESNTVQEEVEILSNEIKDGESILKKIVPWHVQSLPTT